MVETSSGGQDWPRPGEVEGEDGVRAAADRGKNQAKGDLWV